MNESEESPKEVKRQRDELRAALIGLVVTVIASGVIYWLYSVLY